jgi:hypothetical protein
MREIHQKPLWLHFQTTTLLVVDAQNTTKYNMFQTLVHVNGTHLLKYDI